MSINDSNSIGLMQLPELKDPANAHVHANSGGEDFHLPLNNLISYKGDYSKGPLTLVRPDDEFTYQSVMYRITDPANLPFTMSGNTAASWATDKNNFQSVGSNDLLKKLSAGDNKLVAYRFTDVYTALSRICSLSDIGVKRPYLGYDQINDLTIEKITKSQSDDDLLKFGGIFLSKKFRGIRRNATTLSVISGKTGLDGTGFNPQVVGVGNARGIKAYGMNDGVSAYIEASAPALESWETVTSGTYSSTTVTIPPNDFPDFFNNVMVGDVIKTLHSESCWGIIKWFDDTTGVITVDEWSSDGITTTTPKDGTGFVVNAIDKVWGININAMLTPDSYANNAVGAEFGAANNKLGGHISGVDSVYLTSKYNGDAAFLARRSSGSAKNNVNWTFGYKSESSLIGFKSSGSVWAGFHDDGESVVGVRLQNKNRYSQVWSSSDDVTDVSLENSTRLIGPNGEDYREYKHISILNDSATLSGQHPFIVLSAAGKELTMPPASIHSAGHLYRILLTNAGSYTIASNQNDCLVNGYSSLTFTTTTSRKTLTVFFDGTNWQIFDLN